MGTIYTTHCICGYEEEFYLGVGLAAHNTRIAKRIFALPVWEAYEKQKGTTSSFLLANELCFCPDCKQLLAQATFTYKDSLGKEMKRIQECQQCGQSPLLATKPYLCPKCGEKLELLEKGYWD